MDADTERHARACNPYAFRRHIATHPDPDDEGCRIVCDMRDGPDGDARLIAAAPEMLAALERLEAGVRLWVSRGVSDEDMSAARAAIAKARGGGMILNPPLSISPRLIPGVRVGDGWVSWDLARGIGYVDAPGIDHAVTDMRPGLSGRHGQPEERVRACLGALLDFLGACAESRSYGERRKGDPMAGENSDLFPEDVGAWAQQNSDEIGMARVELEGDMG